MEASIPLLEADNYYTWAIKMECLLEIKGLWEAVETGLPVGADDITRRTDTRARAEIGLCLGNGHLSTLTECKTARSLWQALKTAGQANSQMRQLALYGQLLNLKKGPDEPASEYLARAKIIKRRLKSAGDQPKDHVFIFMVLKGLPAEYDIVKIQIQTSDQKLTLDDVQSKLVIMDQSLTRQQQSTPPEKALSCRSRQSQQAVKPQSPMDVRKCHYCRKPGHLQKVCRKKLRDEGPAHSSERQQQGQQRLPVSRAVAAMPSSSRHSGTI